MMASALLDAGYPAYAENKEVDQPDSDVNTENESIHSPAITMHESELVPLASLGGKIVSDEVAEFTALNGLPHGVHIPVKRSRGRPRKNTPEEDLRTPEEMAASPTKRARGRPPGSGAAKCQIVSDPKTPSESEDPSITIEKKGRGRPRIHPPKDPGEKRPRGRPPTSLAVKPPQTVSSYTRVDHAKVSLQRQKVDSLLGIAKLSNSLELHSQAPEPVIAIPMSEGEAPIRCILRGNVLVPIDAENCVETFEADSKSTPSQNSSGKRKYTKSPNKLYGQAAHKKKKVGRPQGLKANVKFRFGKDLVKKKLSQFLLAKNLIQ